MKRSEAGKEQMVVYSDSVAEFPTTLTVSYPEHEYFPIKYNGFKTGGLSITVQLTPGTDIQAAYDNAWSQLEQAAEKQFESVMSAYLENVRRAAERIHATREKRG